MTAIGILGTGSYLPKEEITNEEIARRVPNITAEWIGRRTLIRGRRYAAPHEATSDLARNAATAALERAGVSADRVDHLIVATSTGDAPLPPTSSLVQNSLGATRAVCFDINIACAGFVYALDIARALVAQRPGTLALVIGADLYSRFLDYDDRGTAVLLGDAAGAAVIGEVPEPYGILGTELAGRGDAHELIWIEGGGSRVPASHDTVDGGGHSLRMAGRGVADFVMTNVPPMIAPLLERTGTTISQVDHFVPHQANGVLLGELVERCGLTGARTHTPLVKYGNMGAASVPVALDEAARDGLIADGELLLLAGFGAGMAAGLCLLRWAA
ncbi:3-oxoacyl-ACP synthase III family protein [Streptomyces sp. NBC_00878]|uniref:3-oxoacyl-ACP synthase III family protein n=1 Tax=Streptomyces sp. NBC_00878 TaxID=2975854 RepID=UPI00224D20DE|nr:ketoacyl-ACP synthase III [Streptomyces sp. NBC_00878]MCX4902876.1 ketoacyl-ACP synthase III [Streptomyces sp. NBC_00878]